MTATLQGTYGAELSAFLTGLGADDIGHTGRTLLAHLQGTCALLERWGCPEAVCKAGLFHSIYGTSFFDQAPLTFDDRAIVRERLGPEAERLAWLFCALDRRDFYRVTGGPKPYRLTLREPHGQLEISDDDVRALLAMLWANALDQAHHVPQSAATREREQAALVRLFARELLPPAAKEDLARWYDVPLAASTGQGGVTPGLAALLAMDDAAPFKSDFWPERLYHVHAPVARLKDFLFEDIRELTELKRNHVTAFFRTTDGRSQSLTPTPQQILPLYEAGFTIYFHGLQAARFDPWRRAINRELGLVGGMTRVSAFASRRGLGLLPHYDLNDNIVIQAKGIKRWRVAPNQHVKWPTTGFTMGKRPNKVNLLEAPDGFPKEMPEDHEVIDMRAGSVMFMPRGWWHDTETTEGESLHFNIQTGLPTWKDLARFFLQEKAPVGDLAMREGIADLFEDGLLKPELRRELLCRIRAMADRLTEDDLAIAEAEFEPYLAKIRGANV